MGKTWLLQLNNCWSLGGCGLCTEVTAGRVKPQCGHEPCSAVGQPWVPKGGHTSPGGRGGGLEGRADACLRWLSRGGAVPVTCGSSLQVRSPINAPGKAATGASPAPTS